jgi:uncharacterized protein YcbK (DUF882 family)
MIAVAVAVVLGAQFADLAGDEAPSKKAAWLHDKETRADRHRERAPRVGETPWPMLTLHNVWTEESLPVALRPSRSGGFAAPAAVITTELANEFDQLARCHFTNQSTRMDPRLLPMLVRAALHFHARMIEIVSGFRAPKYQLMLRKKGHEVARDSQHPPGHAVDFRIPGVSTKKLLGFVLSLRLGGVGYYADSQFVHGDVGPVRFWRGH